MFWYWMYVSECCGSDSDIMTVLLWTDCQHILVAFKVFFTAWYIQI